MGQGPADIAASAVTAGVASVRAHLHPLSAQVPHLYHVYILLAPHTPHTHIPHRLPNTHTHTHTHTHTQGTAHHTDLWWPWAVQNL